MIQKNYTMQGQKEKEKKSFTVKRVSVHETVEIYMCNERLNLFYHFVREAAKKFLF